MLEALGILVRQGPGAGLIGCLGVDVEQRPIRIRQHEHPFAVLLVLHAVDLPHAFGTGILRQYAEHAALLIPRAWDLDARDVRRRRLVDHVGERRVGHREELEEADDGEEAVERGVEAREDEAAHAVGDHQRMLAGREIHLCAGRGAHALHPAAGVPHELLDRRGREDRNGNDARRDARGEPRERGEELHVRGDAPAVIDEERLLSTGVDDHANRRRQ